MMDSSRLASVVLGVLSKGQIPTLSQELVGKADGGSQTLPNDLVTEKQAGGKVD